jgi:hypothetical protein
VGTHAEGSIVFESRVTALSRARARPEIRAPVVKVMLVSARMSAHARSKGTQGPAQTRWIDYHHAGGSTMATGFNRNIGMLVLAVWLILTGLSGMVALGLPTMLMAVLALVAGILIIVGR